VQADLDGLFLATRTLAPDGLRGTLRRIRNDKSLAPYRDCLGYKCRGEANCSGRGSFDRGDLKEVAVATGRAMEPQGLGTAICGDVIAADTAEIAFDRHEFCLKRVWACCESGTECDWIADEHTKTSAHKSTWFVRRIAPRSMSCREFCTQTPVAGQTG
jgi:hypothetical protein